MNSDRFTIAAMVVTGLLVFGFAAWIHHGLWVECREAGHSVMYCLKVLSR